MKKLLATLLTLVLLAGFALPAAAANVNPFAPPANLNELSQAEQLEYFNLVVNRVRSERPGFTVRNRHRIDTPNMSFTGMVSFLQPIIDHLIQLLMPGYWQHRDLLPGQNNQGWFMSENENASDLRPEDITAITAVQQDDNWVIDVRIREEINPELGLNSSNGRIFSFVTREEALREISDVAPIEANVNNATMRFHSGYARVTVNLQGQVIAGSYGFQVLAQVNDVRIGLGVIAVTTDAIIPQVTEVQYTNFDWTGDRPPFPPAPPMPAPCIHWYSCLPFWLQWILRWVFFGWIWM